MAKSLYFISTFPILHIRQHYLANTRLGIQVDSFANASTPSSSIITSAFATSTISANGTINANSASMRSNHHHTAAIIGAATSCYCFNHGHILWGYDVGEGKKNRSLGYFALVSIHLDFACLKKFISDFSPCMQTPNDSFPPHMVRS